MEDGKKSLHRTEAAAPHAAAALAIDVGVLESLIGNDPAVILEFLDAFRVSAATILQELKAACADHQAVLAGRLAHKLKSAAYAVGALELGRLCAAMEAAGKEGNDGTQSILFPLFEQELADVNAGIESLHARGAALGPRRRAKRASADDVRCLARDTS